MELLRRTSEEQGLSLVEVLVGMAIAMMALAGMGGMLIASARSQNISEQRVFASQLATQAIEEIQARNWDMIGFWTTDPGYRANASTGTGPTGVTLPTVTFTSAPQPTGNRPLPQTTVARNGVTYTVQSDILWEDPALPELQRSRKHLRTVVSWADGRGQPQTVTAASLRAWPPVQRGPSLFFLVSATAGSTTQLIDEYGFPLAPVPLAAVANRRADLGVRVAFADRAGANQDPLMDEVPPLGGPTDPQGYYLALEGPTPALSAPLSPYATSPVPPSGSGHRFANGTQYFTFTAQSSTYPSDSRSVAVTFLHDRVYVVPGTISASAPFCVKSNGTLRDPVRVSFDVQGFQAADRAQVTWISTSILSTSTASGPASHLAAAPPRGTRQYFDIPQNTSMPGALVTFTIVTNRTTTLPATGLVNLPVSFPVTPC